jgi:transcriptional regulator with XRE-family HTH domain
MLQSSQIRAARALLGWRQQDLASASHVGVATIQRIEKGDGAVMSNVATLLRLQETIERAGVRFINSDDGGGVGVRLASAKQRKSKIKK